jgi:predicted dehydrogenase
MNTYRVAIIGCGRRGDRRCGAYGIAEAHALTYEASERAQIGSEGLIELNGPPTDVR